MNSPKKEMPPTGTVEGTQKTYFDSLNHTGDDQRQQVVSSAPVHAIYFEGITSTAGASITLNKLFHADVAPTSVAKPSARNIIAASCINRGTGNAPGLMRLLMADFDKQNLAAGVILEAAHEFFGGAIAALHSTASALPDDRRWRLVVPLANYIEPPQWLELQRAFAWALANDFPITIQLDASMDRAKQPAYLPNCPPEGRDADGKPLFYEHHRIGTHLFDATVLSDWATDCVAAVRKDDAEKAAEEAAKKAIKATANLTPVGEATPLERVALENNTADLMREFGYIQDPHKPSNWRSPMQKTGSFATELYADGSWHSLSDSDAEAGIGHATKKGGRHGDAADLIAHFRHNGNLAAVVAAAAVKPSLDAFTVAPSGGPTPPSAGKDNRVVFTDVGCDEFMAMPPANWFIHHTLPMNGVAVVYGASKAGKTFLVLDMLLSMLATDDDKWFGLDIRNRPRHALYMALEGAYGVRGRLRAWATHNKTAIPKNFRVFHDQAFNLGADTDVAALLTLVSGRGDGGIIVIDTQAKASVGSDEQDAKAMGVVYAAAERIAQASKGLVLLIAHAGKDNDKGLRGSSAQTAAADMIIQVKREGDSRSWCIEKIKDGPEGAAGFFQLQSVGIGNDERGHPLSSAVVLRTDAPVITKKAKLNPESTVILKALQEIGGSVEVAAWRTSAYAALDALHNPFNQANIEPLKTDSKLKTFNRSVKSLVEAGRVAELADGVFTVAGFTVSDAG